MAFGANGYFYQKSTTQMSGLARLKAGLLASVMCISYAGIAQAQDTGTTVLERIIVEGDEIVVTEGDDSYTVQRVTVGGKQPQDIRDIPQTVIIVPRQLIDDIGATSIEEASKIIPSLTNATGDGFIGSLYSRGQEVFQYYVDGAPRPFLSIYGTAPDLVFFDRLEVLSGPSGVYQGSGEPVGTLNLVRKRPTEEAQTIFTTSGTTSGGYRASIDTGGSLNEDGTLRGRFIAYNEHKGSFVDYSERDGYGFYGTIEVDLSPDTTLSLGGIVEHSETVRFSGLPTFSDGSLLNVDRKTFIGSNDNMADLPKEEGFIELEHHFDGGSVLKATARVFHEDAKLRNLLGLTSVNPTTGNFRVFWFGRDYEQTASYFDVNVTSPVDIGEVPSEIVFGVDHRRVEEDFKQQFPGFPGFIANINTFDPTAYPIPLFTFPGTGTGPGGLNSTTTVTETGIYAQGRFELTDRFKLNLGGRYSFYESDSVSTGANPDVRQTFSDENFAPYVGVTYDLSDDITVYASYAEIFQPQSEMDSTGAHLVPRVGSQYEIGVKSEHFDGMLTSQLSYYWINDTNRAIVDPNNANFSIAAGEAETEGFEILLRGKPAQNWDITAGYAYVSTSLINDPTPEHNFSAFAKYTFDEGKMDGLSLGAGFRTVSDFDNWDSDANLFITAQGYTVVDAFAAYKISENLTAQLNIENLFDNNYVERINTVARGTFYGKPLTAKFTLTWTN